MVGSTPRRLLIDEGHVTIGIALSAQGERPDQASVSVLPNLPQDQIDKEGHKDIGDEDQQCEIHD